MKIIKLSFASALMALGACTHVGQTWVRDYDGNQLSITSGKVGSDEHFINITNTNRTWVGSYKGGEYMVPARKEFLKSVAESEASQICKGNFAPTKDISYEMLDRSPGLFGDGLLGYAVASALSEYENLPTAAHYHFQCPNDDGYDAAKAIAPSAALISTTTIEQTIVTGGMPQPQTPAPVAPNAAQQNAVPAPVATPDAATAAPATTQPTTPTNVPYQGGYLNAPKN